MLDWGRPGNTAAQGRDVADDAAEPRGEEQEGRDDHRQADQAEEVGLGEARVERGLIEDPPAASTSSWPVTKRWASSEKGIDARWNAGKDHEKE